MASGYMHLPALADGRACKCSVCTCGQHHCPGLYRVAPLGGSSHYRDTFTPKKGDREPTNQNRTQPLSVRALPGHFKTTSQAANEPVVNAPMERVFAYKPKPTILAAAPFDGKTTHRSDFVGHDPKLPPRPPQQYAIPKVPGTYDTTLGAMQKPVEDALRNGTAQRSTPASRGTKAIPRLPFAGDTTYTVHYPPKEGEHVRPYQRHSSAAPTRDTRDFQTTKGTSYTAPPSPARQPCPAAVFVHPPSRDGHIKVDGHRPQSAGL